MGAVTALICFVIWAILLVLAYALYRVPLVLTGARAANHWQRGQSNDDPAILQRAKDAHLNCVENLPLFAAVVLAGVALGQTATVDALAAYVFYARVGQSLAHLAGTSFLLVLVRATFFLIQLVLMLVMALGMFA